MTVYTISPASNASVVTAIQSLHDMAVEQGLTVEEMHLDLNGSIRVGWIVHGADGSRIALARTYAPGEYNGSNFNAYFLYGTADAWSGSHPWYHTTEGCSGSITIGVANGFLSVSVAIRATNPTYSCTAASSVPIAVATLTVITEPTGAAVLIEEIE